VVRAALNVLGLVLALFGSPEPATHDDIPAEPPPSVGSGETTTYFGCPSHFLLFSSRDTLTVSGVTFTIIEPPDLT
jgi:hypothetical protein